jgi:hypothetical protein
MTFCVIRYTGHLRDYFFRRKRDGLPLVRGLIGHDTQTCDNRICDVE